MDMDGGDWQVAVHEVAKKKKKNAGIKKCFFH